jgi:hypothetical protein
MKVGDLVRNKHDHILGGTGIVVSNKTKSSKLLGTYYRIYLPDHSRTVWGESGEWEVISESR